MRCAVFAGEETICDPRLSGDLQRHAAADPRPFGLIPLCRQTAMLSGARTESDPVVSLVHPVICAAVIMHIADDDNEFIFLLRQQQSGQIEIGCSGVSGHISGKRSIAEDTASPHSRTDGQDDLRISVKCGRNDLPVVTASDQERTCCVRCERAPHREMGFPVIGVETGGQPEEILFIEQLIMIIPITGCDHFSGVLFCLGEIQFSGFKFNRGIEEIPFAVQGDAVWIHRVAFLYLLT